MSKLVGNSLSIELSFAFTVVFPFIQRLVPAFPSDGLHFLESAVKSILDEREKSERNIPDTVNALLEMRKKLNTEEWKRMGMNIHSVYGQAFEFFIASYFGIHCTISYLSYHLATNPEVARRVQEEVDAFLKEEEKVNYETLSKKLPYLTACFYETWRKTPGFFRLDRVCTKDWDFKGYSIKKGTIVIVPIYPIHHNPDIYPEPEKFEPERFLPGNKEQLDPCAFLQFGLGHRQCIGVKYVVEILKSFMVRVLRDFEIQRRDDTVWKEHPGNHFTLQLDPIFVDLVKRSN
jgi:cytochrome P450